MKKQISFFIPFFNEESNLENSVNCIIQSASSYLEKFEIILINDGSTDSSLQIAQKICESPCVVLIDLKQNKGFGVAYAAGLKAASLPFAMYLTADGDVNLSELNTLLSLWDGIHPLIQSSANPSERHYFRYLLSSLYVKIIQTLSHTKLPYYNGFNILPTQYISSVKPMDFGFSTQAYYTIELLKSAPPPQYLATQCQYNDHTSKAITVKNIISSLRYFLYLYLNFNRSRFSKWI